MSDARLRLFVALALPDHVRRELERWRPDLDGLRAVSREDLHVTLCFLGWVDGDALPRVLDVCRQVVGAGEEAAGGAVAGAVGEGAVGEGAVGAAVTGAAAPAPLALGQALWLPRRAPRVLAVALDDGSGALGAVQARLSSALAAAGLYRPEARPFLPHVTVARVRRGARVRAAALADPAPLAFVGREVIVFRSRLEPGGARYEPLGSVVLGGG